MSVKPLPGRVYVLDLGHPELRVVLSADDSFVRRSSLHRIRPTARFVKARCRGRHPTDHRMFVFDIEEGTPDRFSLKSDAPDATPHEIYGLSADAELMIPSSVVLVGPCAAIR